MCIFYTLFSRDLFKARGPGLSDVRLMRKHDTSNPTVGHLNLGSATCARNLPKVYTMSAPGGIRTHNPPVLSRTRY